MTSTTQVSRLFARTSSVPAVVLAGVLLLTSCSPGPSGNSAPAASEPASPQTSEIAPAEGEAENLEGAMNARAAVELALKTTPGAVVEIELGRHGTKIAWEVGVLGEDGSGVELYIHARSGEVLRQGPLRLDSEQRTAPAVTAVEAIDIALDAVSGRVTAADLGTERGRVVWEVDVLGTSGGMELYIDAATGEVVKQDRS